MASEYILQTNGLTKEFKGFTAVNKVDLKVKRGTIHALIGPNGAGKTTCFNLITKFLQPTAGTILYKDRTSRTAARGGAHGFSAVVPDLGGVPASDGAGTCAWRCSGRSGPRILLALGAFGRLLNERALQLLDDVGVSLRRAAGGRAAVWPQAGAGIATTLARSGGAAAR
jgi:branched-chain amino acid transport system ATP-binding protein